MVPRMHDYTPVARAYWWTTASLGAIALGVSLSSIASSERETIVSILLAALVAAVTGAFPVRVPGTKTSIAVADIFIFLALLIYGPAAATLAAAAEAAVASWRTSKRATSRLGSPAMAALAMYGCGTAFTYALDSTRVANDEVAHTALFGLQQVLALCYFAVNTLLMASLISLKRGEPVQSLTVLRSNGWLALLYSGSGAIAALIFVTFDQFGVAVIFAAAPIICIFLAALHFYFGQIETNARIAQERIAAAERAADETARHLAELKKSESRFHSAFTHAAIGMIVVSPDDRIQQANAAFLSLIGRNEADLLGTGLTEIIYADDVHLLHSRMTGLKDGKGTTFNVELRFRRAADERAVWVLLHGAFFSVDEVAGRSLILQVQDVTARRLAESRLHYIAYHDGLTNLPNRGYFREQLTRAIGSVKCDAHRRFAVLFLDIDRFKTINDSLGHGAGDDLLITVGRRIQTHLRPDDVVARLGGDEFAILVENASSDQAVVELADRLLRALREPIVLGGAPVSSSVSIGITTSAFRYDSPEEVMRDADTAMFRAKALGKDRYTLFDSALHAEVSSQMWLEVELRRALEQKQLTLVYQPIFDLKTRRLTGLEALCRWMHPVDGLIPPDRFIRLAEECGLIVFLGNWVLERACGQLHAWQRTISGFPELLLHVNVSGVQFTQPGFASYATRTIAESQIRPEHVALEVTESVLIECISAALPNLLALREAGVQLSIDDFGTGYSSLSALLDLPIGEIKIDQSFVGRMDRGGGEEVVRAVIAMGRALDKRVIAEGIENEAQLSMLTDLGCDWGQGYLMGRPMAPDEVERMIRHQAGAPTSIRGRDHANAALASAG